MRGSRVAGQASGREDFGPAGAVPHRVYLSRPFWAGGPAAGRAGRFGQLAETTAGAGVLVFVGLPFAWNGRLYNCAAALYDGEVQAIIPKTHIPNYSEFYESRYFAPAPEGFGWVSGFWSQGRDVPFGKNVLFTHGELPELSVGCEICEDLWAPRQPSQDLALAGATIIVNLSASPAVIGKGTYRRDLVASQSARLMCGYLYACACCQESTQDLVYAGHNLIAENGIIWQSRQPWIRIFWCRKSMCDI